MAVYELPKAFPFRNGGTAFGKDDTACYDSFPYLLHVRLAVIMLEAHQHGSFTEPAGTGKYAGTYNRRLADTRTAVNHRLHIIEDKCERLPISASRP